MGGGQGRLSLEFEKQTSRRSSACSFIIRSDALWKKNSLSVDSEVMLAFLAEFEVLHKNWRSERELHVFHHFSVPQRHQKEPVRTFCTTNSDHRREGTSSNKADTATQMKSNKQTEKRCDVGLFCLFSVALCRLLLGITWPRWSSGWSLQWPLWWIMTPWWETSWRSSSWRTTESLWQRKVPFSQLPLTLRWHFTFGMLRKQCARCS